MGVQAHAVPEIGAYDIAQLRANVQKATSDNVLPVPTGHRLLVAVPKVNEKTSGGVILTDDLRDRESVATQIALVVDMGDLAYHDPRDFPNGPWCKTGDFVLLRSYAGTRFEVAGLDQEFRLINDESVEAVIANPHAMRRK